jgi:hypothetical protein
MEIFISIDGVLRNTIQKFEYHYNEFFLNSDVESTEVEDNFEYKINPPIKNDNLFNYFTFHSQEEFENFLFIEFPIEIFGHAGLSYSTTFTDLNKLIYDNKDILGSNIKFINSKNLNKEWGKCDLWITDDERVLTSCPKQKTVIKFNTVYNQHFTNIKEINKLTEIDKSWLKYSENFITSILKRLVNRVK